MCLEIPRIWEDAWKKIIDKHSIYETTLSLTDQVSISSQGQVAWSESIPQKNSASVCGVIGIMFTRLDDKDSESITQYIKENYIAEYPDQAKIIWE